MQSVLRNEGAETAVLATETGERLVALLLRHAGAVVDERGEVVRVRCQIGEHDVVILAAVDFMQAEFGLHPTNPIFRFRIAGHFTAGAIFETRIATVIHLEFLRLSIVNDGNVGAEASFPRLVKLYCGACFFGMMQLQCCALHLVDEKLVHEQLAARADVCHFCKKSGLTEERKAEDETDHAFHTERAMALLHSRMCLRYLAAISGAPARNRTWICGFGDHHSIR